MEKETLRQIVAQNVRYWRKKKGLTQSDLGYLADLHRTYIGNIEQNKRNVSLETIEKIAHALALEPYKLLKSRSHPH